MKIKPINGIYITRDDFEEWQNVAARLISNEEVLTGKKTKINAVHRCKSITFVVTESCNLNCTYCYEKHKTCRKMTKQIAKDAVDFILNEEKINGYYNFEDSPAITLEFIGGEPLLEIELIDYIVEYFKFKTNSLDHPWGLNYMINLTTNGILYEDPRVQKFIRKNKNKVSMTITVDGNKELHDKCRLFPDGSGSYDIVEKSVFKWVENENITCTKITLCPDNINYLNDALKNVWDLGVTGAYTNCVFEPGWTSNDCTILYNEIKKLSDYMIENKLYDKNFCSLFDETIGKKKTDTGNWCGGNGEMLAIAPDGKCFACIRYMKYSLSEDREEQPIGDIYNGLDKKEKNPWLLKLCTIDAISQCQHEDNKKCLDCPIDSGCSLCSGFNYDYFGDPNHKATFICSTHKAITLANVYHWNRLYKTLGIDKKFICNVPEEWALEIISEEEFEYLKSL